VFVPLVDILRCTRAHADTWLVASIDRADGRYIVDGTLGCPTCLAEYPIRSRIAFFSTVRPYAVHVQPNETSAVRVAAALDLTDARMTAVLHGSWGVHAQLIVGVSPSQLLLLNPPDEVVMTDGVSAIVSDVAPLAAGSVSAAAIDKPITPTLLASLRRSLRHGGRLLGPLAVALPDGFTELARDAEVWVARLDATITESAPIPLTRRGGQHVRRSLG
jgi:hypothetical protein